MSLVIKFEPGLRPVIKHQEHDQSTHGSWADSGSPKLTIMGKNDGSNGYFNENTRVVRFHPEGKEPKDYVLYARENFVVALEKPTDGTTIDGYSEGGRNKGEVGHLDITGPGSNPWRSSAKDDGKATIVEAAVRSSHQRRGLASAMLRFHRDLYPELDVQHSDPLSTEGRAWSEVSKHQEHDQSTHGSWANGSGSSGLSHREIYNLQVGRGDPLVSKVYKAEDNFQPHIQRELPMPFPPKPRVEFSTKEEYDKAYKAYSKAFDEWARESHRNIQSPTGEKHLDGSKAGVQKYLNEVIGSDWFKQEFGTGGVVAKPEVKLLDINSAGRYTFGFKNGQPYTSMVFNKGYSKAEPTILHEIAHYATTISQTKPFDGHGVEFAKNHVYIASKAIGSEFATGLEKAYREEGIDLG